MNIVEVNLPPFTARVAYTTQQRLCVTVVDLVRPGHTNSSTSASSSVTGHALRDETHVRHGVRVYIPSTCSLTHVLRTVDWMVSLEADGRASSTRAVADLLCLGQAGGGADSRFISAIR